ERAAVWREDQTNVRIRLLDNLGKQGRFLMCPAHVVQENELRRRGDINSAVRLVQRVLTRTEDSQGLAIRAELRSNRLTGAEVRVPGQPWVQDLLHRTMQSRRRDVLASCCLHCLDVRMIRRLSIHMEREHNSRSRYAEHH